MVGGNLSGRPVVVGVDGSEWGLVAVDLAAREAGLRHVPLLIVSAVEWPFIDAPVTADLAGPAERDLRERALRDIADGTARARSISPDVEIQSEITVSSGAAAPVHASRRAALVVLGERGRGGIAGLLAGSVAVQVATHASCPVILARGHAAPGADIIVGVDRSPNSDAALAFAFGEAAARGADITAVHAWRHPASTGLGDMPPPVVQENAAKEGRVPSEALAGWPEKYPQVTVRTSVVRGGAAHALIEASTRAQLLVIGARGSGGFGGLLLGSVGHAMLHRAACPVAIVHPATHAG